MSKFLRAAIISLAALFTLAPALAAQPAYALFDNSKQQACQGIDLSTTDNACSATDNSGSGVEDIVKTIVEILSFVIGVAAIIMVIIGGLRYIVSNGDSNAANSARNTILYALIGLVIAALAQVLVHFVLGSVSGGPKG